MAKPLSERVASALGPDARLADVNSLIDEVSRALATAQADAEQARQRSLDPDLTSAEVREQREQAEDREHDARRFAKWMENLSKRRQEILEDESFARRRAEYFACREERDALAAEIRERYPAIVAELVSLIQRIDASDARCRAVNQAGTPRGEPWLESAEVVARGCLGTWYWPNRVDPVKRLAAIDLPKLHEVGSAWRGRPNHKYGSPV